MPLNRIAYYALTTTLCFATSLARAQTTITCPPNIEGHPLLYAQVYAGHPSQKADLIPERGGWKFYRAPSADKDRSPPSNLVCNYQDRSDNLVIEIPRNAKCAITRTANAVCR